MCPENVLTEEHHAFGTMGQIGVLYCTYRYPHFPCSVTTVPKSTTNAVQLVVSEHSPDWRKGPEPPPGPA